MSQRTDRNPRDRRQDNAVASILGAFLRTDRRRGRDRRRGAPTRPAGRTESA